VQTHRSALVGYLKVHKYFVIFHFGGKQNHGNLKVIGIAWIQWRSECSREGNMMSPYVSTIQYNTGDVPVELHPHHFPDKMQVHYSGDIHALHLSVTV
jgi:hypothetical protein